MSCPYCGRKKDVLWDGTRPCPTCERIRGKFPSMSEIPNISIEGVPGAIRKVEDLKVGPPPDDGVKALMARAVQRGEVKFQVEFIPDPPKLKVGDVIDIKVDGWTFKGIIMVLDEGDQEGVVRLEGPAEKVLNSSERKRES
jgi:hypothetical protein